MADPVLSLAGVTKNYGNHVVTQVLHGVGLSLAPGEFAALIGPSGSGKSTLLNIMGLLDTPTAGAVSIQGIDTVDLEDAARTRVRGEKIGFIFQFHHLLPAFTALENVLLPEYSDRGRMTSEMQDRALGLLESVGLGARAHYRSIDLSGGQQQRVAIARALMRRPPLILADEPTGNLDTESSNQVFDLLRRFNHEQGSALLVVTHDPRLADRCDRIITLVDGRITADTSASRSESA